MAGEGQVRKDQLNLDKVAEIAGYQSLTSVYTHLDKCLSLNWIGSDDTWYFIRSFDRLRAEYNAPKRTAAELRPEDVSKLDEFLLGAKIKSVQQRKSYMLKSASMKPKTKAEPHANLHAPKPYQPNNISCSLIAEWFGFSAPTASRLKQRAKESGYLNYQHRLNRLGIPAKEIDNVRETIAPASHLTTYKMAGRQYLAIRLTDAFKFGAAEHKYRFKTRHSI